MSPPCCRCGGETVVRSQFPDTFLCRAGKRDKSCGFVWERRNRADSDRFWQPTVTTIRGYAHWSLGPASWNTSTLNRVLCVVRPKGEGWPTSEVIYDGATIYLPAFDEPDSPYSQDTKDRAIAIITYLEYQGRVA